MESENDSEEEYTQNDPADILNDQYNNNINTNNNIDNHNSANINSGNHKNVTENENSKENAENENSDTYKNSSVHDEDEVVVSSKNIEDKNIHQQESNCPKQN